MFRGDLILTPTGLWHEHGHEGQDPVVWLDVLDLPVVFYLETSYAIEGQRQDIKVGRGEQQHVRSGVAPTRMFERNSKSYPMLRYPWADTKAALQALAADEPSQECVQVTYINPETGGDAENILGFYALMLRPGQSLRLPARSPAQVFHATFSLAEADTCCAPGYTAVMLRNLSAAQSAFLFIADEAPLHHKLGVYENRG